MGAESWVLFLLMAAEMLSHVTSQAVPGSAELKTADADDVKPQKWKTPSREFPGGFRHP